MILCGYYWPGFIEEARVEVDKMAKQDVVE